MYGPPSVGPSAIEPPPLELPDPLDSPPPLDPPELLPELPPELLALPGSAEKPPWLPLLQAKSAVATAAIFQVILFIGWFSGRLRGPRCGPDSRLTEPSLSTSRAELKFRHDCVLDANVTVRKSFSGCATQCASSATLCAS